MTTEQKEQDLDKTENDQQQVQEPEYKGLNVWLMRHEGGIYYFEVLGETIAVSETEARYSKIADAALVPDATTEDRACYLARYKLGHEQRK